MSEKTQADVLLSVIQRLNSNPYSLTKMECISVVEEMRDAALSHLSDAQKKEGDEYQRGFADGAGVYRDNAAKAIREHATPPAAAEAPAVPHPGSAEASAMMDSVLAEYNWPANPKNASRAGWVAATRWIAANLATPTDSAVNAGGVPSVKEITRIAGESFASEDFELTGEIVEFAQAIARAALAPKADSSEPVAEIVMFGTYKEASWRKGKMPPAGTKLYATPTFGEQPELASSLVLRALRMADMQLYAWENGYAFDTHGPSREAQRLVTEALALATPTDSAVNAGAVLPNPGSPEASAMIDSVLAEYQYPSNPKNAARAGWVAAMRWLAPKADSSEPRAVSPFVPGATANYTPEVRCVCGAHWECGQHGWEMVYAPDAPSALQVESWVGTAIEALTDGGKGSVNLALTALRKTQNALRSPASAQLVEVEHDNRLYVAAMRTLQNLGYHWEGGELWAPRVSTAQPQADAGVSQIKWPKGRDVARNGDMAPVGQDVLRLVLDSDNDVCMEMWHSGESAAEFQRVTIEFCNGGGGGGQSPKTRAALINLMTAMEEDNADAPHKAHGISPAPKEGEGNA